LKVDLRDNSPSSADEESGIDDEELLDRSKTDLWFLTARCEELGELTSISLLMVFTSCRRFSRASRRIGKYEAPGDFLGNSSARRDA
jgi:hypothetical protein